TSRAYGAGRVLLRLRGHPADLPHARGVELPPARRAPAWIPAPALPPFVGSDVSGRGRILEFPRRRHLRLPRQPSDRLLLRDRHGPYREPRPRGHDGG